MKELKILFTILSLAFTLISCKESNKKNEIKNDKQIELESTKPRQKVLVDYKKNIYKIYIGDTYKTSGKIINWHWAGMDDPDGNIDPTGKDAFIYLEEPLITYKNNKWLPSLHIKTDKNIITSLTCSVLFKLDDTPNPESKFLKILSKDITQLQNKELIKTLLDNGFYEKKRQDYTETFKLIKTQDYGNSSFDYIIELR